MVRKPRPIPEHGTEARYARGCHCRPCTDTAVREDQLRVLDRLQGRPRKIPSTAVVVHLKALRDQGMSWDEIGRAAGTSGSTPREIVKDQRTELYRSTAEKLLAVPLSHRPGEVGMVPNFGAVRRVRALYAIGCSRGDIATRVGVSEYTISLLASDRWTMIRIQLDQAIRRVYSEMWMRPGTSAKNRIRARREGWGSPLAWDDNFDDPAAVPVFDAPVTPMPDPPQNRLELIRLARKLSDRGYSPDYIGPLIGISGRTVFRWKRLDWQVAA